MSGGHDIPGIAASCDFLGSDTGPFEIMDDFEFFHGKKAFELRKSDFQETARLCLGIFHQLFANCLPDKFLVIREIRFPPYRSGILFQQLAVSENDFSTVCGGGKTTYGARLLSVCSLIRIQNPLSPRAFAFTCSLNPDNVPEPLHERDDKGRLSFLKETAGQWRSTKS
jgi:hypothetical protein